MCCLKYFPSNQNSSDLAHFLCLMSVQVRRTSVRCVLGVYGTSGNHSYDEMRSRHIYSWNSLANECHHLGTLGLHLCVDAVQLCPPLTHTPGPLNPLTRSTTHPSSAPHTVKLGAHRDPHDEIVLACLHEAHRKNGELVLEDSSWQMALLVLWIGLEKGRGINILMCLIWTFLLMSIMRSSTMSSLS